MEPMLVSVGVDPGPASGHVCFIGPGETVIRPTPASAGEICQLFDWTGQATYVVVLELQQTFGIEARGRLVPLIVEYGQWQGVLAALQHRNLAVVSIITPKKWQWMYEPLLPTPAKTPKQQDFTSVTAFKHAVGRYKRERERVKGKRKTALHCIAKGKAPHGLKILKPAADAYLLALHAENILLREYGFSRLGQANDNPLPP